MVLGGEDRSLGEGGVEQPGGGRGQQHTGGVAREVAHDLATGRIRRVAREADGLQGGPVEDRRLVQVQNEHRGVGRGGVQLGHGRQPLLRELLPGPATNHPHPLPDWRALGLFPQHPQGGAQGPYAVPAQFEQIVQPAPDDVQMGVVEPGNHAPPECVHDACGGADVRGDGRVVSDGREDTVGDGHGGGRRAGGVAGVDAGVADDELGGVLDPVVGAYATHGHGARRHGAAGHGGSSERRGGGGGEGRPEEASVTVVRRHVRR